jgi:hypothetical protein
MKKIYIGITALLLSATVISCKKDKIQTIDAPIDVTQRAQIKYFNFGVGSPGVNFFANDVKVTGALSTVGSETTTGSASGTVYPQSGYSVISGGAYTFKGQIPSTAATDPNLAIATVQATLENGKYYTLYTSGLYDAAQKRSDGFVVEDKLPAFNSTVAYIRFVNAISNAPQPMSLYVKSSTNTALPEALAASSVAYKSGSDFVALPIGSYELYARYPSATATNVISRNGTSVVALAGGKVYTITSRGDITVTSTTAANRPQLDFSTNR